MGQPSDASRLQQVIASGREQLAEAREGALLAEAHLQVEVVARAVDAACTGFSSVTWEWMGMGGDSAEIDTVVCEHGNMDIAGFESAHGVESDAISDIGVMLNMAAARRSPLINDGETKEWDAPIVLERARYVEQKAGIQRDNTPAQNAVSTVHVDDLDFDSPEVALALRVSNNA